MKKLAGTICHSNMPFVPSSISAYTIRYKTTTCRGNEKEWTAVIFAEDNDDAEKHFLSYINSKKHITNCDVLDVVYMGGIDVDFGDAIMHPISPTQVISFKKEQRHYLKCKIESKDFWIIPRGLDIYRADISYSTKQGNVKTKKIYGINTSQIEFVDDVQKYLSSYKEQHPSHMFKEHILNVDWVGEVTLSLQ